MAATVFRVEVQGIQLPKNVHDAIDADIRRIVATHLATLDFNGDLTLSRNMDDGGGGGTQGIQARFNAAKGLGVRANR